MPDEGADAGDEFNREVRKLVLAQSFCDPSRYLCALCG
jgi:hypothetical protein